MKINLLLFCTIIGVFFFGITVGNYAAIISDKNHPPIQELDVSSKYWFVLYRKSNVEQLFKGSPGDITKSNVVKTFKVKSGIPGERPTPLPNLVGREYWVITKKYDTADNPETAPYFIELDVPGADEFPYGPVPYTECNGQCNWNLSGAFGLHGINTDLSRLSVENPGSSGCIRHSDEDITYLYNLLNVKEEIRYYIEDI